MVLKFSFSTWAELRGSSLVCISFVKPKKLSFTDAQPGAHDIACPRSPLSSSVVRMEFDVKCFHKGLTLWTLCVR